MKVSKAALAFCVLLGVSQRSMAIAWSLDSYTGLVRDIKDKANSTLSVHATGPRRSS